MLININRAPLYDQSLIIRPSICPIYFVGSKFSLPLVKLCKYFMIIQRVPLGKGCTVTLINVSNSKLKVIVELYENSLGQN